MKSLTIEKCTKFSVSGTLTLILNKKTAGSIAPDNTTPTLMIENTKVEVFTATLFLEVLQNIVVEINGEETPLSNYKTANNFPVYYISKNDTLIIDAPSQIAKKFSSALKHSHPENFKFTTGGYNFEKITKQISNTKALYFEVDDIIIDSKGFFGDDIHESPEAAQAIKEKTATYLVAEIDVLNKSRTIGFSQKGTLVFYNKAIDLDDNNYPYVQLALHCVNMFSN